VHELQALGIKKIAPSHCTGEAATATFRRVWGREFLEGGCGAVITVPFSAGGQN
jgi:7,8-dihydropterin-6-yl-methyl-4-(beta-D-ribofuranosyl)aminobenzene 5'-phosphate synthase